LATAQNDALFSGGLFLGALRIRNQTGLIDHQNQIVTDDIENKYRTENSMLLDLNSGILIIGFAQGIFLAVSIGLHKQGPVKANRFLALLLLAFTVALSVHFLSVTQLWKIYFLYYILASSVMFMFGPLIYFYVRQLTLPQTNFSQGQLTHFIPVIMNLILFFPLLQLPNLEIVASLDKPLDSGAGSLLLPILKVSSVSIYTLLSLRLWFLHFQRIRQHFSDLDKKSLLWLRNLLVGFLSFEIIFAGTLIFGIDLSQIPGEIDTLLSVILILLIFMTGFHGLQQPEIFRGLSSAETVTFKAEIEPTRIVDEKYKSSNLNEQDKRIIDAALKKLVLQDKVFFERFLDLRMLAEKVKVTPHQLSQYLNEVMKLSFYDFINQHRVEAAKIALCNSRQAILDIALIVGFNNKATFNKSFKKYTGMTPSQYRSENQ
jgi:AraC-like DNA-binding protein